MKATLLCWLVAAAVLSPAVAWTQSGKSKPTGATYITKEEIDTVNAKAPGTDRAIKVVDIGHENFALGIVHRGKTINGAAVPAPGAAANAAPAGGIIHDSQTEGYYIVSGGGTMFTDGYIVNGRHNLSPELNGPTCGGMAYDVVKKAVKPGDIIIVPAGVVHGWLDIADHVDYLSFRPSPGILTAGWVNPVLRK